MDFFHRFDLSDGDLQYPSRGCPTAPCHPNTPLRWTTDAMPKSGDRLAQIAGSEEHIVRDDSVEKELLRLWLLNLLL